MSPARRPSALLGVLVFATFACARANQTHVVRDVSLRSLPLYFYPSVDTANVPRATVFFFGNDVGFWSAHEALARRLSDHGYSVIGFDVAKYLKRLPSDPLTRDSVFAREIPRIIERSVHELNDDETPLVLAGHSFGADVALWTEATDRLSGVVGVMALSPTERSHLRVTPLDLANLSSPREPGSFAAAEEISRIPRGVRIALMRGSGDNRRPIDSSLVAAGGKRIDYEVIPFAGHSLKSLTIAGPMIERELGRIVSPSR